MVKTKETDKRLFAANLRRGLAAAEMRPVDLAAATGIGKTHISNYLSGYCLPSRENQGKIAYTLGVDADGLTRGAAPATSTAGGVARAAGQPTSSGVNSLDDRLPDIPPCGYVTVQRASKALGVSPMCVSLALRTGRAPYGYAVPTGSARRPYLYHISAAKLRAYLLDGTALPVKEAA